MSIFKKRSLSERLEAKYGGPVSMLGREGTRLVVLRGRWNFVLLILILNFSTWAFVSAAFVHGEALTGKEDGQHWFVNSRTGYHEVSRSVYQYSKIHTLFTYVGSLMAVWAVIASHRATMRLREILLDEG